jgi:alcohol dehydrogenase (cytochrome c)
VLVLACLLAQLTVPAARIRNAGAEPGNWLTYSGNDAGHRHSPLDQINIGNVASLRPAWVYQSREAGKMETSPIVIDGTIFLTEKPYIATALDGRTGRPLWSYRRPPVSVPTCCGPVNRGPAVLGDALFFGTLDAHLVALDLNTGRVRWDVTVADSTQGYSITGAPLAVKDRIIIGVAGGEYGTRGFLDAYDARTGARAWRFWTVPAPGQPGGDTWTGDSWKTGGATTWVTGAYDPALDLIYWGTGNPGPNYNGDGRAGDNLYSNCLLALEASTGKLRWHFQFTPHDVWDYDAQETPALVDAAWQGRPRKLLVQANRNGYFYVLDRTDGKFLLGKQYAKTITWSKGLTPEGRPIVVPNMEPTHEGKRVCPSLDGASNWYSTAYNPATGLYYVQTNDKCGIFTRTDMPWQAGKGYMGGSFKQAPNEPAQRVLRAFDLQTGKAVWELPQTGDVDSWGGVLTTAGGVVFFGEDSGSLMAADAKSGKPLWHFQTSQLWKASPMTYMFDNKQYVAVAAGSNIIAFGLPDDAR